MNMKKKITRMDDYRNIFGGQDGTICFLFFISPKESSALEEVEEEGEAINLSSILSKPLSKSCKL